MQATNKYNKFLLLPALLILVFAGEARAQYRISGLVDFSYRHYESIIGDQKTSDEQFNQLYKAGLSNYLWDPRFLRFSGDVAYNLTSSSANNNDGQDMRSLNYNLYTSFFPGMKISWDLFGTKATNRVESDTNIAGYETDTTSYGGTLHLHLGTRSGAGNNNNNRNNNNFNNNQGWTRITPLPDITLSRIHTETESLSSVNPQEETRDNTKASLIYRYNSLMDIMFDGGLEEYKNLSTGASYDLGTANLTSLIRLSPGSDLNLVGRRTERTTANIPGYDSTVTDSDYSATLNFREKNGITHFYRYNYRTSQATGSDYTSQRAEAQIIYRYNTDLSFRGGVDYSVSEFLRKASLSLPEEKSRLETGGVLTGVSYNKLYTPQFLGPFGFNTSYDFTTGFAKLSNQNTVQEDGTGWYYSNSAGLGFRSVGWKEETASIGYLYSNKRDYSPINNDTEQHGYNLSVSTNRIPRTTVNAAGNYSVQKSRVDTGGVFLTQGDSTKLQYRTVTYNINAVHSVTSYFRLTAGATRGNSTSLTTYTLSTLPSMIATEEERYYAGANFIYSFTRNVQFRASFNEEYRTVGAVDTTSHQANLNVDYRIRAIFISLEYRLRQDVPDNSLRTTQQYYFAKLTRPF